VLLITMNVAMLSFLSYCYRDLKGKRNARRALLFYNSVILANLLGWCFL
jgi:hypothetical protein